MSSMIDIATPDGVADCYLARPEGREARGGVLLMIDAIGLRQRIRDMADHIAAHGYVVLAPNIFYRAGRAPIWPPVNFSDPEARAEFMAMIRPLSAAFTAEALASDGRAYLDKLGELGELSGRRVGIAGYCMGGRLGWQIAASFPDRVAALGGFHVGGLVTDDANSPHLHAPEVRATIYWGFADHDPSMPAEKIEILNRTMDAAGLSYTTEIYEGAAHGYTMADQAVYDAAATERHWAALFDLLARTL